MEDQDFRRERYSLGDKLIPQDAYWGIHSWRVQDNFPLPQEVFSSLIKAYFAVKWACARASFEAGLLEANIGNPIIKACEEGMEGKFDEEIIVPIFQGDVGTSLGMNMNEATARQTLENILSFPEVLEPGMPGSGKTEGKKP